MSTLRFLIEGPDAEAAAEELRRDLLEILGAEAVPESLPPPEPGERATDPIAVAGLILAIPGALLAVMDLAERLLLKQKIAQLIARLKARRALRPGQATLLLEDGRRVALDEVEPEELLALAAGAAPDRRP